MRERSAINMIFRAIFWETIAQLGAGAVVGSVNLDGTPRLYYIPIVICFCDYFLIGDELYAAAALVNNTPLEFDSIFG